MMGRFTRVAVLGFFSFLCGSLTAAERPKLDGSALAAEIDRLVLEKLKSAGVAAMPPADDATFFRRLNLTLAGRIPASSEVQSFLADMSPDKRARAVERLLASPAYVNHLTTSWSNWLLPEAATDPNIANAAIAFKNWLRGRMREDVPFDRLTT